ncbi:MAG: glycoside hydrolase family 88 protein [Paludibacter sp.]|nr:glycoside hydrolase family 88 protein [Paludibacter sp.]
MKKSILLLSFAATFLTMLAQNQTPYSKRMADSQMARSGVINRWDYPNGLFVESVLKVYDKYGDAQYYNYALSHANATVNAAGKIGAGYNYSTFNIDYICPGMFLLRINELAGNSNPKFKIALDTLRKQIQNQPRNTLGGFWHKKVYPNQMWLDGIFMGSRFYAKYDLSFNGGQNLDDVINQFALIHAKTYDHAKQLNYHAWAENTADPNAFWARQENPFIGCSHEFWSRGNGWYFAALADVLEIIPANHPRRAEMIAIINDVAAGIKRWQEPNTGLWYQLTEYNSTVCVNGKCNYLEGSASSMFTYALLKAIRLGFLSSDEYLETGKKAYQGIIANLISTDTNGLISLNNICRSAGLGPANSPNRDGSIVYYLTGGDAGQIVSNDLKGVGPFIMASIEYETLMENQTGGIKKK